MSFAYGAFVRCRACGHYDFTDHHRCPPMFHCRFDHDGDDDWTTVHATDAEEAAAIHCERVNQQGDYHIIQAGRATVWVRSSRDDPWRRIEVTAETRPHYSGREAT